jgi:hypothetical protein
MEKSPQARNHRLCCHKQARAQFLIEMGKMRQRFLANRRASRHPGWAGEAGLV